MYLGAFVGEELCTDVAHGGPEDGLSSYHRVGFCHYVHLPAVPQYIQHQKLVAARRLRSARQASTLTIDWAKLIAVTWKLAGR